MKKLFLLLFPFSLFYISTWAIEAKSMVKSDDDIHIIRENVKAFIENDLDKYVLYDLMSDGSKVFKDTLAFNEYRDKAIFTITQNQTFLNIQLWVTISLLMVIIGLLVFITKKL